MMRFKIIIYMLGILIGAAGTTMIYFNVTHFLEQQEIKEEGTAVEVTMLKPRHARRSIAQIKYKEKVYDWQGGTGKLGYTYSVIYSPKKDKFLDNDKNYILFGIQIIFGISFIGMGIGLIVKTITFF